MKINEHEGNHTSGPTIFKANMNSFISAIITPRILLVPYCAHHVPTYHTWMRDPEIQKATASEPLTLDEEYAMQRSWRTDHDKLTFIACYALEEEPAQDPEKDFCVKPEKDDAPDRMIGDVNLFLYEDDEQELEEDDDDDDDDEANEQHTAKSNRVNPIIGELEIMLAHRPARGQGLAQEVLLAFMWHIVTSLTCILDEYRAGSDAEMRYMKYLRVKIDQHNVQSLALFQRLGFERKGEEPNYFGEVEMRMQMEDVEQKVGEGRNVKRLAYGK
jgi:RimJ/RimL family protein N-acetyltransferase